MNPLENKLRKALRQPSPPADLEEKVLTYVATRRRRRSFLFTHPVWSAATAALAIAVGVGAVQYQQEREERLANERAKEQVLQAFRLAAEQLRPLRQQLLEMEKLQIPIPKENN